MKYTLHDYQRLAATEVLSRIKEAHESVNPDTVSAFALTAPTGSGKTVIAATVIEALFHGSDDLGIRSDKNTAIVWLTDNPSLNNQTIKNMKKASGSLDGQLVSISEDNRFDQKYFEAGNVYFLNVQKLHKASTSWVGEKEGREFTLWETFANTIKASKKDGGTKLLVIIDEAHRGIGTPGSVTDKQTTLAHLISGDTTTDQTQQPLPLVWGISATPDRFNTVMTSTGSHNILKPVGVDVNAVRQSGLLKDSIVLANTVGVGVLDTSMLREAVRQTIEYETGWANYAVRARTEAVEPVLVVQVDDKVSSDSLTELVDVITSEWKLASGRELPYNAIVNVFGEHSNIKITSKITLQYMPPENIQDADHVRVVFAKDAITTGWDCPRAEVLFSLHKTSNYTIITQMIGRMVRTPLAIRIDSDETLNTVSCFLPKFDSAAVDVVINNFMKGANEEPLVNAVKRGSKVTVHRNIALGPDVFALLESIPSETLPRLTATNSVTRLKRLATKLSLQKFNDRSGKYDYPDQVAREINDLMDSRLISNPEAIDALIEKLEHRELSLTKYSYEDKEAIATDYRSMTVDANNIEDTFKEVDRLIPEGVIKDYERHLKKSLVDPDDTTQFIKDSKFSRYNSHDTKTIAAAIGLLFESDQDKESTAAEIERICESRLTKWNVDYFSATSDQTEKEKAEINAEISSSPKPELTKLQIPKYAEVAAVTRRLDRHVLIPNDGDFPFKGNEWEEKVLSVELNKNHLGGTAVAWYRNPSQATANALSISYAASGKSREDALDDPKSKWSSLLPDFLIIRRNTADKLTVSIVDPHGTYLEDTVRKIKALAEYAKRCEELPEGEGGFQFARIQSVAKNSDKVFVFLNLKDSETQDYVRNFTNQSAIDMFDSIHAKPYA